MSSSKAFVVSVNPRDAVLDMDGLSLEAKGGLFLFWMLHEMHREPLPPREEKRPRAEWDEWFRDKLDMKNVRTWRRIKAELLAKAKIRQTDEGRLYIARTMRAVERKRGGDPARWGAEDEQGALDLQGVHCAQVMVDKPVEEPGEGRQSPEHRPMFGQTSPDVRPNRPGKPLIVHAIRPALSYSNSKSLHELLLSSVVIAARARGDPAIAQA